MKGFVPPAPLLIYAPAWNFHILNKSKFDVTLSYLLPLLESCEMAHASNTVAWEAESERLSQLQGQCEVYYECKDRVNYGVKPYPNTKTNPQSLLVLRVQKCPFTRKSSTLLWPPGTYLYPYICGLLLPHANPCVSLQHSQNHKVIWVSFPGWIGMKY